MPTDDKATALAEIKGRQRRYQLYADYYDGDHRIAYASEKFRTAFGNMLKAFAENACPVVVQAISDNLEVTGFEMEIGDGEDGTDGPAAQAWDIWQANRMDQRSVDVHIEALRSGDAYVIVWPDADGKPIIYPQRAANIYVEYDDEAVEQIAWAAKLWQAPGGSYRLNLYYPDRIEKYATRPFRDVAGTPLTTFLPESANAFEPYEVENEPWPLPNEWGVVPVFHFPTNADVGHAGRSELQNVIPLQDALNKVIMDLLVAMEYVSFPQRWVTGLEVDRDPATGKIIPPFEAGPERIWATESEETRFGEFNPADLTQFVTVADMFRLSIVRVTGTPMHYMQVISGQWPSGESLKTATERFTAKVRNRQVVYGNVWENVIKFCLRIAGVDTDGLFLSALWRDPTPRSDMDFIEQLKIKRNDLQVPIGQIWAEAGYSDDQIARMEAELAAEETRALRNLVSADDAASAVLGTAGNAQATSLLNEALARGE